MDAPVVVVRWDDRVRWHARKESADDLRGVIETVVP